MFERGGGGNGTDSSNQAFDVVVEFSDGHVSSGTCYAPATRTLADELNHAGAYLDFEPHQDERAFIAKTTIVKVSRINMPKVDQLSQRAQHANVADPYTILNVKPGTSPEDIQTAYHSLAREYHPDRFAGMKLPSEMLEYANAMTRRINDAHALLQLSVQQEAERLAREAVQAATPKNAYEQFKENVAARQASHRLQ